MEDGRPFDFAQGRLSPVGIWSRSQGPILDRNFVGRAETPSSIRSHLRLSAARLIC